MATKPEKGAGPLRKEFFFAASLTQVQNTRSAGKDVNRQPDEAQLRSQHPHAENLK